MQNVTKKNNTKTETLIQYLFNADSTRPSAGIALVQILFVHLFLLSLSPVLTLSKYGATSQQTRVQHPTDSLLTHSSLYQGFLSSLITVFNILRRLLTLFLDFYETTRTCGLSKLRNENTAPPLPT